MRVSATARIQVTVEISGGSWESDCGMEQLFEQAAKEARIGIQNVVQKMYPNVQVIGDPIVLAILIKKEE